MMTSDMILKLINQNAVIRSDKWQGFVKYTPYKGTTQPSSSLKKESKKEKLVAQEAAASDAVSSPDPVTPVTPSAPDSSPATRAINKSKPKGLTAVLFSTLKDNGQTPKQAKALAMELTKEIRAWADNQNLDTLEALSVGG